MVSASKKPRLADAQETHRSLAREEFVVPKFASTARIVLLWLLTFVLLACNLAVFLHLNSMRSFAHWTRQP
jgi:hypothetical protein